MRPGGEAHEKGEVRSVHVRVAWPGRSARGLWMGMGMDEESATGALARQSLCYWSWTRLESFVFEAIMQGDDDGGW